MIPAFSNERLSRLSGWATDLFGLRFPPDRWSELARGLASAALELGIADLAGWSEDLLSGNPPPDHLIAVANHLTISETYFFRHPDSFEELEHDILPGRIARRREQRQMLRIWSAGCASGEEPYSIAILLRERFRDWPAERSAILGTDINRHVLARAERGLYSEWSFRDTPEWVRAGYFRRTPNRRYEVVPEVRAMVRFTPLNFAAPLYPAEFSDHADFDVVLCRNVLMYFSAEWQARILQRLVRSLAPDGWLLLGPCDITAAQSAEGGLAMRGPGTFQRTALPGPPTLPRPGSSASREWVDLPLISAEAVTPLAAPAASPSRSLPPALGSAVIPHATEGEVASARAQSHANRGELDQALAACDEAIALDKLNPTHHYLRACILQEQNRLAEAAESFRRVLFLDPTAVMAHFALGSMADRLGRRDEARRHFSLVLDLLQRRNRGETIPGSEGLTVGRLRAVVQHTLSDRGASPA